MKRQQPNKQVIVYQTKTGALELKADLQGETIWLTQQQMAELFDVQKAAISKHLKNIFDSEELQENSVVSILETTAEDNKIYQVKHFNLDAVLSVGYRVNSKKATHFRQWATKILKSHVLKGYTINRHRIKTNYEAFLQAVAGAKRNIRDKKGKGLAWYAHASAHAVGELLLSIGIEPERDSGAGIIFSYFRDGQGRTLTYADSKEKHGRVLIAKEPPAYREFVKAFIGDVKLGNAVLGAHLADLYKQMVGVSMRAACLAGQVDVRRVLGYEDSKASRAGEKSNVAPEKSSRDTKLSAAALELNHTGASEFGQKEGGDLDMAISCFAKVLDIKLRLFGEAPAKPAEQFELAQMYHNLAAAYLKKKNGKEHEAIKLLEKSALLVATYTSAAANQQKVSEYNLVVKLGIKIQEKFVAVYREKRERDKEEGAQREISSLRAKLLPEAPVMAAVPKPAVASGTASASSTAAACVLLSNMNTKYYLT